MAFSVSIFTAKTCLVLLLPASYVACSIGNFVLRRSQHLFIIVIASIFLNTDNNMIGLRFDDNPGLFPGFGEV